jgi:hypothetical protein
MLDITKILPRFTQLELDLFPEEKLDVELGERQELVYKTLKSNFKSGATAKELSVYLHNEGKVMSNERNSVHPRLNELISLGLVKVDGKKTCQYTDRKVSIYKTI